MMTETRWLPIPEAPDYSISEYGEVRDSSGGLVAIDAGRVNIFRMGIRFRLNVRRIVHSLFPDIANAALNEDGEIWKPIPGHDGYEISNHARVRRGRKITNHGQRGATRIISPKVLKTSRNNGYLVAYLGIPNSKKARIFYLEKCLFELFPELLPQPQNLEGEQWQDIRGHEGLYQISNLGRVASLHRTIDDGRGRNRYIRARIRELGFTGNGYPKVELARKGITKSVLLHRLVAEAFIPNPKKLPIVHHKDEDKTNTNANNLEWTSEAGNVRDWFDAREHRIDAAMIERIAAASAAGQSPAEILASLPRKRKTRKS